MNPIKKYCFIIIALFSWLSCEHVDIDDLSNEVVSLVAPPNNSVSQLNNLTFWWEAVEDADEYNLQIAQYSFDSIGYLILDTTTAETNYSYNLPKGVYQWRVKAVNNASESPYFTFNLEVEINDDLDSQTIILKSPKNNLTTNEKSINFEWNTIEIADVYTFQLAGNFGDISSFIINETLTGTSYTHTFESEGSFEWRVRAENQNAVTAYVVRSLGVDCTAPIAPQLLLPVYGDTVQVPISLVWESEEGTVGDSLFIYTDALGNDLWEKRYVEQLSYDFVGPAGNYFWKLKALDAAGNESDFSPLYTFIVE